MKNTQFNYRADIDGLRAIAVLAVVFFHLDYEAFSGGFIGVDIFFVISGFLISQIIYKRISQNSFSFKNFYKSRAFRILPVLFVVLITCLLSGYFILLRDEYFNLGESSIASLFFFPNILYWLNTGYFEVEAETTPLLHLWSLGVEEQFYFIFPLFAFVLFSRFKALNAIYLTALITLISFYLNLFYTTKDITFAFYMIHTRAWEFLAGLLLTLFILKTKPIRDSIAEVLSFIGFLIILFSIFTFNKNLLFPGYYAILPVIGSLLIIYSGSFGAKTLIYKLLSHKYSVYIGLISYSLYLWHWPITVYFKMIFNNQFLSLLILVSSFIASIFSYHLLEQPFRGRGPFIINRKIKVASLVSMGLIILSFSIYIMSTQGISQRLSKSVKQAYKSKGYLPENRACHRMKPKDILDGKLCVFGDTSKPPSFALFGDSHAEAMKYGLKLAAINKGKSGIQYTKPGCRPIMGIDAKGKKACLNFTSIALQDIMQNPEISTVFLAGYWSFAYKGYDHNKRKVEYFDYQQETSFESENSKGSLFFRGLHRTIQQLIEANKRIVVIEDNPVIKFNPRASYARNILLHKEQNLFGFYQPDVSHLIKHVISTYEGKVEFMPTKDTICPNNPCRLVRENNLIFRDGDHLTRKGAALLRSTFEEFL